MEQLKRQRSNSFGNYDNRKKIQVTTVETNHLSNETITYFEDLSNELIYEIFEFLDYFHVYKAFFHLNRRFYNLLTNSNLPIKINISFISKSVFQNFNKDIIIPNKHRINSFYLSNPFIYDFIHSPIHLLPQFSRLERFVLENIESNYFENLIPELIFLPKLSSLSVICTTELGTKGSIYPQIFRLPALKYCNLTFRGWDKNDLLPMTSNEYSSLEHLIINHSMRFDLLADLLTYVPKLRRLSLHSAMSNHWKKCTTIVRPLLNHLTHVSLQLDHIKFENFEQLIIEQFSLIHVLHISIHFNSDSAYADAKKWEKLIVSHMPNLRIFDIRHDDWRNNIHNNHSQLLSNDQIDQFTSSFWIERQWFFAQQYNQPRYRNYTIFFSTNPYRRKYYTLYDELNGRTYFNCNEINNMKSVQQLRIGNEKGLIHCKNYFPNVNELIFEDNFSSNRDSITTIINHIIPLQQLTKLVIHCKHFAFIKMIDLLNFSPNIHTLIFESMPLYRNDCISIQQSETFQLVSNTNIITNVTFKDKCTTEKLQLFVALCPQLQYLTLNAYMKNMESIIRFLSDKNNQNTLHLSSLCFLSASNYWTEKLQTLIKSDTLFSDYMFKLADYKLYIWW